MMWYDRLSQELQGAGYQENYDEKKLQVCVHVTNCNLGTKVILTSILWIEICMEVLGFQKEKE